MAKQVQLRRGSASDHTTFTGAVGELTYVSDDKTFTACGYLMTTKQTRRIK
jgi:hypothetical protein